MKEIRLGSKKNPGLVALVDDEDFESISKWKWYAKKGKQTFYAVRSDNKAGKMIRMHRQIMSLLVGQIIDHKDHNGLNNQKSNLRMATYSQNCANRKRGNSGKYVGVTRMNDRYISIISINRRPFRIGVFDTEIDAAIAFNKKALELHGEFASLNKV